MLREEPDQSINHRETIDRQRQCLKGGIKQTLAETVSKIERKKKNEWMTDEIVNMMNNRRSIKIGSAEWERLQSEKSDWNAREPKRNGTMTNGQR